LYQNSRFVVELEIGW